MHEPAIEESAAEVVRALEATGLPVHDERARRGELRYLIVRRNHEGRLLVVVVTHSGAPRPCLTGVAEALLRERPDIVGLVHNVNPSTGGVLLGPDEAVLAGTGVLAERLGPLSLELSAGSFFQVNREQAVRLYDEVARAADARPGLRAADLYSGVGGIALWLARRGARVVGVEAHPDAVADARRAAGRAGLASLVRFEIGDAAPGLAEAVRLLGGLDAVVVDPPRRGLAEGVRAALLATLAPRLGYASCGPESMARDLALLRAEGFRLESVQPVDLMPGTPQIEVVAALRRDTRGIDS